MASLDVAELAFMSYCDVSYAGVRALVETIAWHKACGHDVKSQPLDIVTQSGDAAVPLPHLPAASITISTVAVNGRPIATYAAVHCALLRTHASAIAASVVSELARRGARRIFLLSALHQPLFAGLRCATLSGDPKFPSALPPPSAAFTSDSFESRDGVVIGCIAAALHSTAAVGWVFCSGDRLRSRDQGSRQDKAVCALLLSAVEALLDGQVAATPGFAQTLAEACARRAVTLPEDAAFMYHDPPAAGDVIYN